MASMEATEKKGSNSPWAPLHVWFRIFYVGLFVSPVCRFETKRPLMVCVGEGWECMCVTEACEHDLKFYIRATSMKLGGWVGVRSSRTD